MRCYQTRWIEANGKYLEVPCGKCLACLNSKRNDWAFRLQQEHKASQGACFITLTYHPKFVPDGLNKKHIQDYMKRLRKAYGQKLRYFCVGEYGTKNGRPHYHIILFNYDESEKGNRISWAISKAWRIKSRTTKKFETLGIVDIRPLNEARIMYATKYIIQCGHDKDYTKSKPFMLCSRAYGLGLDYLSDNMASWHRRNRANYTLVYGQKRRLPRYYKEKIWYPARKPVLGDVYRNKLPRNGFREHPDRRILSTISIAESQKSEQENRRLIMDAGYKDPDRIIVEMRNAVISRLPSKIAYTQIL